MTGFKIVENIISNKNIYIYIIRKQILWINKFPNSTDSKSDFANCVSRSRATLAITKHTMSAHDMITHSACVQYSYLFHVDCFVLSLVATTDT